MADHGLFDLAVIGAGPAGSMAAYVASRRGLKVALVDRSRFPRDKTCGDGIGPTAVRLLQQQDLGGIFEGRGPIRSVTLIGPTGERTEGPVPDVEGVTTNGYVISRLEFDHFLFEQAIAAGAYDFSGMRYMDMREAEDTRRIRLKDESGAFAELSAHLIVGADGAYSSVRKQLVEHGPHKLDYMGLAMRAYATTPDFLPGGKVGPSILFEFSKELLPGYGWVFPLGDGRVNLGVGRPLSTIQRCGTDLRELFAGFVAQLEARGIRVDSIEGLRGHQLPTVAGMPTQLAFDRAVLIGDAAAMINPVSGEGIGYAMAAAVRLAEALPDNLEDGRALRAALARFDRDFRVAYNLHFMSCRFTMALMFHKPLAPMLVRATMKDPRILDDAISMLFGDGRLHTPTLFRFVKAALS